MAMNVRLQSLRVNPSAQCNFESNAFCDETGRSVLDRMMMAPCRLPAQARGHYANTIGIEAPSRNLKLGGCRVTPRPPLVPA